MGAKINRIREMFLINRIGKCVLDLAFLKFEMP
jgi:hypothetical protein